MENLEFRNKSEQRHFLCMWCNAKITFMLFIQLIFFSAYITASTDVSFLNLFKVCIIALLVAVAIIFANKFVLYQQLKKYNLM